MVAAAALGLLVRALALEPFAIPSGAMVPTLLVGDRVLVWKLAYGLRLPAAAGPLLEWAEPRRGDVVVFRHPLEPERHLVKRVVGLPGDVVEIRGGALFVNGVPQALEAAGEVGYEERSDRSGRWWSDACAGFREWLAAGPVAPPRDGSAAAAEEALALSRAGGLRAHAVLHCQRPRPEAREGPFPRVLPGHLFVLGDNRDRSEDSRSGSGWQVPRGLVLGRAWRVGARWVPAGEGGPQLERLFKPIE